MALMIYRTRRERGDMDELVNRYRYPRGAIIRDYVYSAAGTLLTLGPLGLTTPLPAITGILVVTAGLFLVFGLRTFIRHNTVVEASDTEMLVLGPRSNGMRWDDLRELRLSYFTTKRDGRGGWMQLRLKHDGGTLRFDSSLAGFDEFVAQATRVARKHAISLEPATAQNLHAMGLWDPEGPTNQRTEPHEKPSRDQLP